jgi:LysM repeat protein
MTRKQMAFIVAVNAVVSTLITLLLVLIILPAVGTPEPAPSTEPTQAVAGQPTSPGSGTGPTATPIVHVVASGDTISGLALRYDVPAEDIIAANQLQNPNFLQLGMRLTIPVGGVPLATATLTPVPTATETPLPVVPPSAERTATAAAAADATATGLPTPVPSTGELKVEITEIIGVGQEDQEQVVITNAGARLADMQGWTLRDSDGNEFVFPNFRLWQDGSATVHTRMGQDGNPPSHFYWKKLEPVWSAGEEATLENAAGEAVSTYVVEP